MAEKSAILLIGSQKPKKSTSEVIGGYLLNELGNKGFATSKFNLLQAVRHQEIWEGMVEALDSASVIILSAPLYVDSTPAHVIQAMERLAGWHKKTGYNGSARFLAICNSGFPEAHQNDIAIAIYRQFALAVKWQWAGGFEIGGGGAITPDVIAKRSQVGKNLLTAFDSAVESLVKGKEIPAESFKLAGTMGIPLWMYNGIGNLGMLWELARHGALLKTFDRPYEKGANKPKSKTKL